MADAKAQGVHENNVVTFGPGLTVGELRVALQSSLRKSGALRALKTQLRGAMLTNLLHARRLPIVASLQQGNDGRITNGKGIKGMGEEEMTLEEWERTRKSMKNYFQQRAIDAAIYDIDKHNHYGEPGKEAVAPLSPPPLPSTWPGRIADCLIHNHLLRSRRDMSLAIFATEAEVPPLSDTGIPEEEEQFLRQLLGLVECSSEEEELRRVGEPHSSSMGSPLPSSKKSALHALVEEALYRRGELEKQGQAGHRHQCGTQTEDFSPSSEETNPIMSLECRLAAVDAKYALVFSQQRHGGAAMTWQGELERRMAQYKEDLHQLLRGEYQQKYRNFEQTTLQEAKEKWELHNRQLREHMEEENKEKQRTMIVKNDQERMRLTHLREDLEQQRLRLEKKQLEMIAYQQECEAQVDALQRQGREMREKMQTLKFQCEKWEELCATRLEEAEAARVREMRRVEEIRNVKADHAVEMHVLEEEVHHLRFRLHMLSNRGVDVGNLTTEGIKDGGASAPGIPSVKRHADAENQYSVSSAARQRRNVSPPFSTYRNYNSHPVGSQNTNVNGSVSDWNGISTSTNFPSREYYSGANTIQSNEGVPFNANQYSSLYSGNESKAIPSSLLNDPPVTVVRTSLTGRNIDPTANGEQSFLREKEEALVPKSFPVVPLTVAGGSAGFLPLSGSNTPSIRKEMEVGGGGVSSVSSPGSFHVPAPVSQGVASAISTRPLSHSVSSSIAAPLPQEGSSLVHPASPTGSARSPSMSGSESKTSNNTPQEIEARGYPPESEKGSRTSELPSSSSLPLPQPKSTSSPLSSGIIPPPTPTVGKGSGRTTPSSSLLEHAAEIIRRKLSGSKESSISSSSSSSSSDSRESCSRSSVNNRKFSKKGAQASEQRGKNSNAEELQAQVSLFFSSETAARATTESEEAETFKGILWAARSQRTIIQAKEEAEPRSVSLSTDSSSSSDSSTRIRAAGKGKASTKAPWELEEIAQKNKHQQEAIPMFVRDSDEDSDSLLYRSSSDSSF